MDCVSENPAAIQARSVFAMNAWSAMKDLDDLDYDIWSEWKLNVQFYLGLMDLDLALLQDKPAEPTDTSSPEEKSKYQKWERSNRMSLMLMKTKMSNYICSFVPQNDSAKEYFAGIENLVMEFEKDVSRFLLSKLLGMKYKAGQGNVLEHLLTMTGFYNRLIAVNRKFPEDLFLELVKNSLPSEFDVVRRIADKEEWGLNEVISGCWRWEKYDSQDNKGKAISLGTKRGRRG